MNKTQLINQVARKAGISRYAARSVVNACFGAITSSAYTRRGVTISGFGRFWCEQSAGRRVINPRTRRSVWRRGQLVVNFSPTSRW